MIRHAKRVNKSCDFVLAGSIHIDRIIVNTIIGVHDWERKSPRVLYITLKLGVDLTKAIDTDDLAHTVDYDALANRVKAFSEANHFQLVESLAGACAQLILTEFGVLDVLIRVDKPDAISISPCVSVELFRSKS